MTTGDVSHVVFSPVQFSVPASGDCGFIPRPTSVGRFRLFNNFRLLRRAILELSGRMEQLQRQFSWCGPKTTRTTNPTTAGSTVIGLSSLVGDQEQEADISCYYFVLLSLAFSSYIFHIYSTQLSSYLHACFLSLSLSLSLSLFILSARSPRLVVAVEKSTNQQ